MFVDGRGYGQRPERFAELVQDQVEAQVDVLVCGGEAAAHAAQQATATIPIVFLVDDAIRAGLVRVLAKPGGNMTGVSILSELDGKRQEILLEAVPGLRRMLALADPGSTTTAQAQTLVDVARAQKSNFRSSRLPAASK